MTRTDNRQDAVKLMLGALLLFTLFGLAANSSLSAIVPPPSGILPVAVNVPSNLTTVQARPYFDDFSWRSFIALNWPAVPNQRGVPKNPNDPNVFLKAGKTYQTVWSTYREAYELYRIDNTPPAGFASSAVTDTVCGPAAVGA